LDPLDLFVGAEKKTVSFGSVDEVDSGKEEDAEEFQDAVDSMERNV